MSEPSTRGVLYVCPVCGAEILVIARRHGKAFCPQCCNVAMEPARRRAVFFRCPVCGAGAAIFHAGTGRVDLRCCNRPMQMEAA